VLALAQAGLPGVDDFMNFICLIAVLSAGNSSMFVISFILPFSYASSRSLMALSESGHAPRIFARTRNGVPLNAIFITTLIGRFVRSSTNLSIAFLGKVVGDGVVFDWLVNITGLAIILTWLMILFVHQRFRRAYLAQGYKLDDLPYRAILFPYGNYYAAIIFMSVIIVSPIVNGWDATGEFSAEVFHGTNFRASWLIR
jgi:lysine-specific permease